MKNIKSRFLNFLQREEVWYSLLLLLIMGAVFMRVNHFYEKALEGTKMQQPKVLVR